MHKSLKDSVESITSEMARSVKAADFVDKARTKPSTRTFIKTLLEEGVILDEGSDSIHEGSDFLLGVSPKLDIELDFVNHQNHT